MKTVACIFAHPDDEAFGPGGTIAALAERNRVHIITATRGGAGQDSTRGMRPLARRRVAELQASAAILGAAGVSVLRFQDGELSNNRYHEMARALESLLRGIRADVLLTFEPRGVSGHLDHIAVSMVVSYVFERLARPRLLLYYCVSEARARAYAGYFVHVPRGYPRRDAGLIVKTRAVADAKRRAMFAHESQRHDVERILARASMFPQEEWFLVRRKRGERAAGIRSLFPPRVPISLSRNFF